MKTSLKVWDNIIAAPFRRQDGHMLISQCPYENTALCPNNFRPDVMSVWRGSACLDISRRAGVKFYIRQRLIHIAVLLHKRVVQDPAVSRNRSDLRTEQISGNIIVMDRAVNKDPAAVFDKLCGRRSLIARKTFIIDGFADFPASIRRLASAYAGSNRLIKPTWQITPVSFTFSETAFDSSRLNVSGFSTKICLPFSVALMIISPCVLVGVTIMTASMPGSSNNSYGSSDHSSIPNSLATCSALLSTGHRH